MPVQRSSTVSRPVKLQRADRPLSPLLVEARAEQMIEEIVALGDRIEHSGNTRRFLRWSGRSHSGWLAAGIDGDRGDDEIQDADVAVEIERELHLREIVALTSDCS